MIQHLLIPLFDSASLFLISDSYTKSSTRFHAFLLSLSGHNKRFRVGVEAGTVSPVLVSYYPDFTLF